MKLVLAHDHKLRQYKGRYYTTGGFSDEIIERYTTVFGNMTFICRAKSVQSIRGLVPIHNSQINIVPVTEKTAIPSFSMIRAIKKELDHADRVIVRLPSLLGIYTAFIAKKRGIPTCVEVVGSAFGSYWYKNILGKAVAFPLELLNRFVIKHAAYVLYVSEGYLQKKYVTDGCITSCSDVILEKREHGLLTARVEKIRNKAEKHFILGTLAQIDYAYKGQVTVLKAIAELKSQGYSFEYRLAGSGSSSYLKKIAKQLGILDDIVFYGQLKHEKVNEWIDDIDLYIQPSLTEGIPRSVIEVLYRGCPVIVSSAGGMYELMEEVWIFNKGNVESLVEMIAGINHDKLIEMANRNYTFSKKFDYIELNKKRRKFYENFKKMKE